MVLAAQAGWQREVHDAREALARRGPLRSQRKVVALPLRHRPRLLQAQLHLQAHRGRQDPAQLQEALHKVGLHTLQPVPPRPLVRLPLQRLQQLLRHHGPRDAGIDEGPELTGPALLQGAPLPLDPRL